MIIRAKAYPRVGLIGNPSDGYYGKTISFTFSNFCAEVVLYESPELEILSSAKDQSCFTGIENLVLDVNQHGYYGGIRLLKATIKRFYEYCSENHIELHRKNFTIRYHSNIPHGVGLAGSSAIITACFRALMSFYGVSIPKYTQANLILAAEVEELQIAAGLQDRVIQVYEGLVFMDFSKRIMNQQGFGRYEEMDPKLLPPLFVAYRDDLGEPTEVFHNNIRDRFNRGEKLVIEAMRYWADLTDKAKQCLLEGKNHKLGALLDANFNRRKKIYRISQENLQMIDAARSVGAGAKFTGSGGAIVGAFQDDKMFQQLKKELAKLKIKCIKPKYVRS
jgi:glucuronokinase